MRGKSTIRETLSGNAGELSSKRVMTYLSFITMTGIAYASIFLNKEIQQFIFEGFLYIVLGGLFSVASEKFSQKFIKKEQYTTYEKSNMDYTDDEPDGEQYRSNTSRWEADD